MTETEKRMQDALARLDAKGSLESLESLDDGSDREALEALENLAEENPAAAAAIAVMIKKEKAKGGYACSHGVKSLKKASVTIKVTRTVTKGNATAKDANGVDVVLPAPVFGVLEYESNYSRVMSAFLPKDGSIRVKAYAKTADSQGILITYATTAASTQGDDAINETIVVLCPNSVYTNLIRGLSSYQFNINKPKLIIGDVLRTDQFDQPINVFNGSMFTAANTDSISPNDYKQEVLSDNTVRVLQDTICVSPEKTLIPMVVPTTLKPNGSTYYFTLICPLTDFKQA